MYIKNHDLCWSPSSPHKKVQNNDLSDNYNFSEYLQSGSCSDLISNQYDTKFSQKYTHFFSRFFKIWLPVFSQSTLCTQYDTHLKTNIHQQVFIKSPKIYFIWSSTEMYQKLKIQTKRGYLNSPLLGSAGVARVTLTLSIPGNFRRSLQSIWLEDPGIGSYRK